MAWDNNLLSFANWFVLGTVNMSYLDRVILVEVFCQLVPCWCQVLAVPTPVNGEGSVKPSQDWLQNRSWGLLTMGQRIWWILGQSPVALHQRSLWSIPTGHLQPPVMHIQYRTSTSDRSRNFQLYRSCVLLICAHLSVQLLLHKLR